MVGHFGARTRFNYTAVGDGVNLAARLEPLCKQYGVTMLVSDDVVKAAGSDFAFRRVDCVAVKGKSNAIDVHELRGLASDVSAEDRHLVAIYEGALDAFMSRAFDDAIALLAPLADRDPPSALLLARARACLLDPPDADWNGTRVLTSK